MLLGASSYNTYLALREPGRRGGVDALQNIASEGTLRKIGHLATQVVN